MSDFISTLNPKSSSPNVLRAMIEIIDGELKVFPIADSDGEERQILDALRFYREDRRQ
jgi:hypothetical protein